MIFWREHGLKVNKNWFELAGGFELSRVQVMESKMYDRNSGEINFGSSKHKVSLNEGSSYGDSTVFLNIGFSLNFHSNYFQKIMQLTLWKKKGVIEFAREVKEKKCIGHDFRLFGTAPKGAVWWKVI